MDEIQKVLVKAGRKDLAQQYYKKIAVEKKDFNISEIRKIQSEVEKAYSDYYDSYEKGLQKSLKNIEIGRKQGKRRVKELFSDFFRDPSSRAQYNIMNGIFGPNEIRRKEEEFKIDVDSQDKKLESLENKFADEVEFYS